MNPLRRFLGIIGRAVLELFYSALGIILSPLAFVIMLKEVFNPANWRRSAPVPRTVSAPQVPSGAVEPPHGYRSRTLPNGGVEITLPLHGGLQGLLLVPILGLGWMAASKACSAISACRATAARMGWVFDLAVLFLVAPWVAAVTARILFPTHGWVAGPGWIARRTYVPFLRRFPLWERIFNNLSGFEIHHGIWDTRRGYTDTFWLRTADSSRKIRVHQAEDHGLRRRELHELTVDPDISALGRFLANKTGTPLSEITEEIPEPSGNGGK